MRVWPGVIAASIAALGGCHHPDQPFSCKDSSQCLYEGAEGLCELTGFCSFPDAKCPGGRRYGQYADDPRTGTCVPARSCGDKRISSGEECDDGNQINGDGCTNACVRCGASDGDARFSWDKNASCYTRHDRPTDWAAAADYCASGGGHLVVPTTNVEHDLVTTTLLQGMPGNTWMGLSDRAEKTVWTWITGEPDFINQWRNSRPDTTPMDADCVALVPKSNGPGYDWIARPCGEKARLVCERPPWRVHPKTRHAYKVIYQALTWAQGVDVCKRFGGHLATITSEEENDFITGQFFGRYWLGASDFAVDGTFRWINGERWRFTRFAATEPDDFDNSQHCLDMGPERRWHDYFCDSREPALCELD